MPCPLWYIYFWNYDWVTKNKINLQHFDISVNQLEKYSAQISAEQVTYCLYFNL